MSCKLRSGFRAMACSPSARSYKVDWKNRESRVGEFVSQLKNYLRWGKEESGRRKRDLDDGAIDSPVCQLVMFKQQLHVSTNRIGSA